MHTCDELGTMFTKVTKSLCSLGADAAEKVVTVRLGFVLKTGSRRRCLFETVLPLYELKISSAQILALCSEISQGFNG